MNQKFIEIYFFSFTDETVLEDAFPNHSFRHHPLELPSIVIVSYGDQSRHHTRPNVGMVTCIQPQVRGQLSESLQVIISLVLVRVFEIHIHSLGFELYIILINLDT